MWVRILMTYSICIEIEPRTDSFNIIHAVIITTYE